MRRAESLSHRIRAEGLLRTVSYAVGVLLLPKIGIEIKNLYELRAADYEMVGGPPEGCQAEVIDGIAGLRAGDLEDLVAFEGEALLRRFERDFAQNNLCVIARGAGGRLAGAGWISPEPPGRTRGPGRTFLIRDCFTLPQMRGRGVYPTVLDEACTFIKENFLDEDPTIAITSIYANRPSIRGIRKCGFRIVERILILGRRQAIRVRVGPRSPGRAARG